MAAATGRPPRLGAQALARRRLQRLLDQGARTPLTVLRAPAGAGKTTALAAWLEHAPGRVAWVSLDAADDDARRLWARLLAALGGVVPAAVQAARRALHGAQAPLDAVVALAVTGLERHAPGEVAIVLDDYHHVRRARTHRTIESLLDTMPPNVRVVIAGRTTPPLRLARRRAAGTVTEIGTEELAFRSAEVRELLNARLGLRLSPPQLAMVEERVAGWPAGIGLVAVGLEQAGDHATFTQSLTRAAEQMDERLAEAMLAHADPDLAELLLRTSILPRFTASLCDAVAGLPRTAELLAAARRSNLLVADLDSAGAGPWYRYHDLFAALLRRELTARAPHRVPELHRRASAWFEQAGMAEEAIAHAGLAGDGPRAARLLHDAALEVFGAGRHERVIGLVERMPAERGAYGPFTAAAHTLALQLQGAAPSLILERWEQLDAQRDAPGVRRLSDAARVWPFSGRVADALRRGRVVYDDPETPPATRDAVAAQLALALWFAGETADARAVIDRHLEAIMFPLHRVWAHATLALCAVQDGDELRALDHGAQATEIAEAVGGATALPFSIAEQAHADALRLAGRHADAAGRLARAERVTGRHPRSLHHGLSLILRAELQLARHERHAARRTAVEARALLARYPDVGVLEGRVGALKELLEHRADSLAGSAPTAAERRVLELLDSGLTLARIADELYVSIHTIKTHRRRLYRRLGVDNRADALAVARRRGLL